MEIRCLEKFLLKRSDIGENKNGASWDAWIKSIPGKERARCKFPEAGRAWLIPEAETEPGWSKVGLGHGGDGRSRGQPGPALVGPCYSVRVQSPCGSTFMESHGRLLSRGAMWPNLYCEASIWLQEIFKQGIGDKNLMGWAQERLSVFLWKAFQLTSIQSNTLENSLTLSLNVKIYIYHVTQLFHS